MTSNRDTTNTHHAPFLIILKALSNKIIKKIRVIGTLRPRFNFRSHYQKNDNWLVLETEIVRREGGFDLY